MVLSPYVFIWIAWPYKNTTKRDFQDTLMPVNRFLPVTLASNAFKLFGEGIILNSYSSFKIYLEFVLCGWSTFGQYYISFPSCLKLDILTVFSFGF